jgi:hypothetical protein
MSLAMTDSDTVCRAHGILLAHGIVTSRVTSRDRQPWKTSYSFTASGVEMVQAIAAMLWPWLGSRRRARVAEVLAA